MKTGKVTLRSEPPRPKNEILALILFGTADGVNPQPAPPGRQSDGTMRAAVGLGGAFVAQGLTEALDDLAGIQATARIDTTRAAILAPRSSSSSRRRSRSRFAHVIGTPPITEPDKNLANIEYRFHRNWSLETTFGDRGTALLDAILAEALTRACARRVSSAQTRRARDVGPVTTAACGERRGRTYTGATRSAFGAHVLALVRLSSSFGAPRTRRMST